MVLTTAKKNVELSTSVPANHRTKLCVYELYAACNKKCSCLHRKGMVFNENTTKLREYIRANKICVAFMLFGKCSHKRKVNTKHVSLSTVRNNFKNTIPTRHEQKPVPADYALAEKEQQNMALILRISELEEKLSAYKNTISHLVKGLESLHDSIAPSASMSKSIQTDSLPLLIDQSIQTETMPAIIYTDYDESSTQSHDRQHEICNDDDEWSQQLTPEDIQYILGLGTAEDINDGYDPWNVYAASDEDDY
jgi:hypothetical protein